MPAPAQALLVTTFVYALEAHDGRMWVHDGTPEITVSGGLAFTDRDLMVKASEIAHRHREWLEKISIREIVTETTIHRAAALAAMQRASAATGQPERTQNRDYWKEVKDPVTTTMLLATYRERNSPANLTPVVKSVVDTVYQRVYQRRKAAREDPLPPRNFKKEAQEYLTRWLQAKISGK
jgi:hypothetical protein